MPPAAADASGAADDSCAGASSEQAGNAAALLSTNPTPAEASKQGLPSDLRAQRCLSRENLKPDHKRIKQAKEEVVVEENQNGTTTKLLPTHTRNLPAINIMYASLNLTSSADT